MFAGEHASTNGIMKTKECPQNGVDYISCSRVHNKLQILCHQKCLSLLFYSPFKILFEKYAYVLCFGEIF